MYCIHDMYDPWINIINLEKPLYRADAVGIAFNHNQIIGY